MAKIKYTKNELKAQRDSLKRFQRYLPTLVLKKQQLQAEIQQLEANIEAKAKEEEHLRVKVASWIKLFSEEFDFTPFLEIDTMDIGSGNIAGVKIPVFTSLTFVERTPDFFATRSWVDDAIKVVRELIKLRVERKILREQQHCIEEELRTTNQRVNLFEKVKIPECKDVIRTIRIFLGDQQTAAVARAKIAKGKAEARA